MSQSVLNSLKTRHSYSVWEIFHQISQVPRKSGNEQGIIEWLEQFAKKHSFTYKKDAVGNILMQIPPSPGYEKAPTVILQSHMDMVCEKTPDSHHDFSKDPIELVEHDGWIYANNTTLGADNGLGMALGLAAALDKNLKHPAMELLFTVDEETGLTGANSLQNGFIEGKVLLNLDSEDEGIFTIGCAGGKQTDIYFPLNTENINHQQWQSCTLKIAELKGGHSGVNIIDQRANAIKIMAHTIEMLSHETDCRLSDMKGGSAHNAIPRDAEAHLLIPQKDFEKAQQLVQKFVLQLQSAYTKADPKIHVELNKNSLTASTCYSSQSTQKLIQLIISLHHGVYRMSENIQGLVETSCNLANLKIENSTCHILMSQRSSNPFCLEEISLVLQSTAQIAGAKVEISGGYPPWHPNPNSALLKKCVDVWKKKFSHEPVISVIHAGLECGVIGDKFSGLDMISFGPTVESPHSPKERAKIDSVDHLWDYLFDLLSQLKEQL